MTRLPREPSSDPFRESVADVARTWSDLPDVLADPTQLGEHGVWTLVDDVYPGVAPVDGQAMTAAWGDRSWIGRARWDPAEHRLLWLEVVHPPRPPDPVQRWQPTTSATDNASHDTEHSAAILGDFHVTVEVLLAAIRRDRHIAGGVIDVLARLPRKHRKRLLGDPAILDLYRLARHHPPTSTPGT